MVVLLKTFFYVGAAKLINHIVIAETVALPLFSQAACTYPTILLG